MANDGKALEQLVAQIERALRKHFTVQTSVKTTLEDGSPAAEFDVVVSGIIGGARVSWTIECRDRPNSRKPDAAWIQQLAGRRLQYGHNWAMAVSTTGFTRAAREAAKTLNIELRVVENLSAEQFRGWCPGFDAMENRVNSLETSNCRINLPDGTAPAVMAEAKEYIIASGPDGAVLKTSNRDEHHTINGAVMGFLEAHNVWSTVPATGMPYPFAFKVTYKDDDHYVLNLPSGVTVRVGQIIWSGNLKATESEAPVVDRREYRRDGSQEIISQVMAFEPVYIGGPEPVRLEIHRIGDHAKPNEVQVVIKPISKTGQA